MVKSISFIETEDTNVRNEVEYYIKKLETLHYALMFLGLSVFVVVVM